MRLQLSPRAFWALTVTEWRWILAASHGGAAMDGSALQTLIQQYPDEKP